MISLRRPDNRPGVGTPKFLVIDDDSHAVTEIARPGKWADAVLAQFAGAGKPRHGDILFLVHGFNVDHDAALAFHAKCRSRLRELGWMGEVVSYDWPSDGLVFAYLPDRANARASASQLVQSGIRLLQARQRPDCTITVHVMAHSMGAFVTQQAFNWAYQDVPPDWALGQVLLVAGDVDHTVFSATNPSAAKFDQHAGRLTAYRNRYDKALLVSNVKKVGLAPRVGRVGLPDDSPAMMVEVDCSDLFDTVDPGLVDELSPVTTHCFYFDQPEFWRDVVLNLAGGIDRAVFPTREPAPGAAVANRFALKPAGPSDADYDKALQRAR